jgi:hypothetical protein
MAEIRTRQPYRKSEALVVPPTSSMFCDVVFEVSICRAGYLGQWFAERTSRYAPVCLQ